MSKHLYPECPQEYAPTRERIKSFSALGDNWDSYGADEVSAESIDRALTLLDLFETTSAPCPEVFPTMLGCVQFEWKNWPLGLETEAEMLPTHAVRIQFFTPESDMSPCESLGMIEFYDEQMKRWLAAHHNLA